MAMDDAVKLVREMLEVCEVNDADLDEVLRAVAVERLWEQTAKYGIEGLERDAEAQMTRYISLGRAVEGIRNYLRGPAGQGKGDDPVLRRRREVLGPLIERIYELGEEELAKIRGL